MLEDVDLEWYSWPQRPSAGGQQVGTYGHGVLLVHAPTGIAVTCVESRSQLSNRERAKCKLDEVLAAHRRFLAAHETAE